MSAISPRSSCSSLSPSPQEAAACPSERNGETLRAGQELALTRQRSRRCRRRVAVKRTACRFGSEEVGRLLQQPRRDDQPVDLVGALVDPRDARVAIGALRRELARVPVAAENLQGLVDRPRQRLAGPHLVDRAFDREAFDRLQHARGVAAVDRLQRAVDVAERPVRPSRRRRTRGSPSRASFCLIRPNSAIALPNCRRSRAYLTESVQRLPHARDVARAELQRGRRSGC